MCYDTGSFGGPSSGMILHSMAQCEGQDLSLFGVLDFSTFHKSRIEYLWYKGLFHDFMAGPGPKAFPEGFCKAPIVQ